MSENIQSISQGTFTIGQTSATNFVAGPGIKIDEPSAGTVRIGTDETVLWSGFKTDIPNTGLTTYTLSELATNFERVKVIYVLQNNVVSQGDLGNKGIGTFEIVMNNPNRRNITYVHCVMNASNSTDSFTLYDIDTNVYNMDTLTWGVKSKLRGQDNNGIWFHITKIIGINRISGSNA